MTNLQPKKGGGVVRIVLGVLILVFAGLGTLGNLATGQMVASGGAAETFGAVLGRLILFAIGVALLVAGLRARRRARS
jgi:hypothetical protein